MSRVGKSPVTIPKGCTITLSGQSIKVKGPKGELNMEIHPEMKVEQHEGELLVTRPSDEKNHRALHGLTRNLINNMVIGVSEGFKREMTFDGVGYKAAAEKTKIVLNLGYSHPINMEIPAGLEVAVEKNKITVSGIDKHKVGQFAADIRAKRPPEPYKGHGIRYIDEKVRRKAGKRGV